MSGVSRYIDVDGVEPLPSELPSSFVPLSATEDQEERYIHPSSKQLFNKCNGKLSFVRQLPTIGQAIECYGWIFICTLTLVEFMSIGLATTFLKNSLYPLLKTRFVSSTLEYQRYSAVADLGSGIKPFTALVTDAFVFYHYKKRWVMGSSAVLSAVCFYFFSTLPSGHQWGQLAAGLAFLIGYCGGNIEILLLGLYSRKVRRWRWAEANLVSTVWFSKMIAGMISCLIQGPLSDAGIAYIGPLVGGTCMLLCAPLLLLNLMEENKNRIERYEDIVLKAREDRRSEHTERSLMPELCPSKTVEQSVEEMILKVATEGGANTDIEREHNMLHGDANTDDDNDDFYIPQFCGGLVEVNKEVITRNIRVTIFCVVLTALVIISAVVNIFVEGYPLLITAVVGSAILIFFNFWSLPRAVAKISLFGFLKPALGVSFGSAITSFYLEGEACNPGGPHFSYFFFNTITGIVGYGVGIVTVLLFTPLLSKRSYRVTYYITTTLGLLANVFDLIMIRRWNIMIGIPDHYMYIFGDAVIAQVVYMLRCMPIFLLTAKLCPRGSEAMVYALLDAFSNFGNSVSSATGVVVLQYIWPVQTVVPCDFQNLWKLVILSGFVISFTLSFPLIYFLIPTARICDDLDENGNIIHPESKLEES